jgi:DNA-binding response OmpR family regulator
VEGERILVVEDDQRIGSSLARALQGQGYSVEWARNGADALDLLEPYTAFVILDLGLPDVDGVDLCRTLRAKSPSTQVLILTARGDEVDVVVGLDAGADDYIVKPFGLAELLARIRVCERRRPNAANLIVGDLEIAVDERRVTVRSEPVELSAKEYELLVLLARNAGEIVRRSQLIESIWDPGSFGSTKTIDTHVWSLRRKLDGSQPSRITTVRGVGYRLERS